MPSSSFAQDLIQSFPATEALKEEEKKRMVAKEGRGSFESKMSLDLFNLDLEDNVQPFPAIEWDSSDESDSDSVRSFDAWTTVLGDMEFGSSLGKRSRDGSRAARRLVRSKKIKSDLSSLAMSFSARSA